MSKLVRRLTERFDHHDPDLTPDLAEVIHRRIQQTAAVTYSAAHGGFWILSRHQDIKAALKDHRTFSSGSGVFFPRAPDTPKFGCVDYDPPDHTRIRGLMQPPLAQGRVQELTEKLAEIAADLVAPIVDRGHGDFLTELALPMALRSLAQTIGFSADARSRIRSVIANLWNRYSHDLDSSQFWPPIKELLADEIRRVRENPTDDHLSFLVRQEIDGQPISDAMLHSILVAYCAAGHETTMNFLSRLLWYLARRPELQRRLAGDPDLRPLVVEEAVRRWTPIDHITRLTTREVTVDGITIPSGSRVMLFTDAANHDSTIFADPEEFHAGRPNRLAHLSFGYGIHHCMGIHLARAEFGAVLGELARHNTYRLTEEPRRYFENGRHIVFDRVPVQFDSGQ